MRADIANRLAQSIQLLHLDGYGDYTINQLANASGISRKTISRNKEIVEMLDFALNRREYDTCILQL